MTKLVWKYLYRALLALVGLKFVRDTASGGIDFEVFWRAALGLMQGNSPYSPFLERPGLVFKYPPWTLPFFLPLALLPLQLAKLFWGILEMSSLIAVLRWLRLKGVRDAIIAVTFVSFWGIWVSHFQMGQVTVPVLAVALWGMENLRGTSIFLVLSSKIFSIVALMGESLRERRLRSAAAVTWVLIAITVLSLPALFVTTHHNPVHLLFDWIRAAGSGGAALEGDAVRGWGNQGFPALFLRLLDVPAANTKADLVAFLICALVGGFILHRSARKFSGTGSWAAWLAFSAAVHPLAWFHSFVLAFPLLAMATENAVRSRNRWAQTLALLALLAMGGLSKGLLGDSLGIALLNLSIKSWAVALAVAALAVAPSMETED